MRQLPTRQEAEASYRRIALETKESGKHWQVTRELCRDDSYFRLTHILNIVPREIVSIDWVYDRCREVEREPWGYIDLWAREHFKTTVITENGLIGDILKDPEGTSAVFSFNRPQAKKIVSPVIAELESNEKLKALYPDILWADPRKQAPRWNQDEGYIIKRRHNPKEPTIMSSGLVDGQPTGLHFKYLRYDDVETIETVRSPEMITKTADALKMSYNLGISGSGRRSWVGTIYAYNDIYLQMIKTGTAKPRIYPATRDGSLTGDPWLWSKETLAEKVRDMGPYIAACQLFLNPSADAQQTLLREWLRTWRADRLSGLNIYILVDPATEKKKSSDYTVYTVVGLGSDRNYYIIRQIRDRLNLRQRANTLFSLVERYRPILVGYEKYGMQSDIEYITEQMELRNYRFSIIPVGGTMAKEDRIRRLVPALSEGRIYLPESQPYQQYDGTTVDLSSIFLHDEYLAFPFSEHDDMLDSLARILDPDMCASFPQNNQVDPLLIEQREETWDLLWSGIRG